MLTAAQQAQLRKLMIVDEEKRNHIYKDSLGLETEGIGHLRVIGFSDAVVELIFQEDWQACEVWLLRNYPWYDSLDLVRKLAMINMRFQLGPDRFSKFKATIDCMARKDYFGASKQILTSKWAQQTPKRNARIASMILHGVYPPEYGL